MPRYPVATAALITLACASALRASPSDAASPQQQFWSFRPLNRTEPPAASDPAYSTDPIDRFIRAAQAEKRLSPAPEADRRTLVRRLYFDLTGLPPSPQDLAAALSSDTAYESLVDALLASPAFGERWARHWLDAARYAESDGYEADADRPTAWHYRDFVIRAFNDDLPFDRFVKWQLAGDEYEPNNPQALAATGFLAAAATLRGEGTRRELLENRYNELDDMLSATGSALLGLTIGCARCHDHKYDPIPTRDYYRMLTAFVSTTRRPAPPKPVPGQVQKFTRADALGPLLYVTDAGPTPAASSVLARGDVDKPAAPAPLGFLSALTPGGTGDPDLWYRPRAPTSRETDKVRSPSPGTPGEGGGEGSSLNRQSAIGNRQSEDPHPNPLPEYREREQDAQTTGQRRAMAEWMTDVDRGAGALLARVIVNRLWQHHFGQGLVRTPGDFGAQGERPSHPELLDYLASQLIRSGWRLKPIHRLIVTSSTYRQATAFDPAKAALDPENRLLWRRRPRRLEAEALRDAILSAGGQLRRDLYGPSVKPYVPPAAMAGRNKDGLERPTEDGPEQWRRSVYLFVKRSIPEPMLTTFDAPLPSQSCTRRTVSTVPTQALALLNDPFVRRQAEYFARRCEAEAPADLPAQVRYAYTVALAREPTEREAAAAARFVEARKDGEGMTDLCHLLMGLNEFAYVD